MSFIKLKAIFAYKRKFFRCLLIRERANRELVLRVPPLSDDDDDDGDRGSNLSLDPCAAFADTSSQPKVQIKRHRSWKSSVCRLLDRFFAQSTRSEIEGSRATLVDPRNIGLRDIRSVPEVAISRYWSRLIRWLFLSRYLIGCTSSMCRSASS